MPCGPRALITAYVAYQTVTFAERDVLIAALAQAGYRVETAPEGTEMANPLPVLDASRRIAGKAALVIRRLPVYPVRAPVLRSTPSPQR